MALDPRPSRRLTSREQASVLGSVLGGFAFGLGSIGEEAAREALRFSWAIFNGEKTELKSDVPPYVCGALGGLFSYFSRTSGRKSTRAAVTWWLDNDKAWEAVREKTAETRATIREMVEELGSELD